MRAEDRPRAGDEEQAAAEDAGDPVDTRAERAPFLTVKPTQPQRGSDTPGKVQAPRRISVSASINPTELAVDPGEEASFELAVRNTGTIVDQYRLAVVGEAGAWASIEPSTLNIYPETQGELARIRFRPPRSPQTAAGRAPFQVKAVSREDPGVMAMVQGALQVGAYHDLSIEMVPQTSRHRRSTEHEVSLRNRGNVAINAALGAGDPNNRLSFAIDPSPLRAAPGGQAAARVRIRARRWRWLGLPETHSFKVTAAPDGPAAPLEAAGQFIQEALIPRWVPRVAIVVIPLLIALLAFFSLTSTVPAVDNLAQIAATDQLQEAGFEVREIGQASDTVPAGAVIRTDPEGGERKRKNTTVKAFLSLGKNPVSIPNVIGLAAPLANSQLLALGLVVRQAPAPDETIPKGTVFATDPPANTRVAEGSTVTLNVSSGPPPGAGGGEGPPPAAGGGGGGGGSQEVKIPDCAGLGAPECESRLEKLGLVAEQVKEASPDVAAGKVIGTDPPGGQEAEKGSTVTVRVSSGSGAAPAPASDIKANPTGLLFGNQRLGTRSAPKAVTLRNGGSAPATIESVTPSGPAAGDFAVASNTCATIAPQGQCSFNVIFGPKAKGTRIAQIAVKPGGGGKVINVGVLGAGINTPPRQLSPADGATFKNVPRTATLKWERVEGATGYVVEVQSCPNPSCTDANASPSQQKRVTVTEYTIQFKSAQPGRWRVWAVMGSGAGAVETEKSPWWGFKFTA